MKWPLKFRLGWSVSLLARLLTQIASLLFVLLIWNDQLHLQVLPCQDSCGGAAQLPGSGFLVFLELGCLVVSIVGMFHRDHRLFLIASLGLTFFSVSHVVEMARAGAYCPWCVSLAACALALAATNLPRWWAVLPFCLFAYLGVETSRNRFQELAIDNRPIDLKYRSWEPHLRRLAPGLVVFVDPQDALCRQWATKPEIQESEVQIFWRWYFPSSAADVSLKAAYLVESCAGENVDLATKLRQAVLQSKLPLTQDQILSICTGLGISKETAEIWINHPSRSVVNAVQEDQSLAKRLGIHHLPGLSFSGHMVTADLHGHESLCAPEVCTWPIVEEGHPKAAALIRAALKGPGAVRGVR